MTDSENHIFGPDVVLASEFHTARTGLPDPERALLVAVLEDAARCLRHRNAADRKQRALYLEADNWIRSSAHAELFDFENVCDVLGIDPDYLRKRLLALRPARARDRRERIDDDDEVDQAG